MHASVEDRLRDDTGAPVLSLCDLSYSIGEKPLLHPLTLDLPAAQSIALVGHNGSGKSTLLKLMARQLTPTGGSIVFEDQSLQKWDNRAFARKLAYLPQHPPITSGLLVHELVALGRYPWHGALGRFSSTDKEKVGEAITRTQIGSLIDRLVDTLSGGERQRVWLAMLIAQGASCLLLDEPTSALDIGHQLDVLRLVHDLSRENGISVITVLHDINMAARFCDHIVALRGGHVIANGSPDDIMTPDILERIYGIRMDIIRQPDSDRPVALAQ